MTLTTHSVPLAAHHRQEWTNDSAVDPALVELNVRSLNDLDIDPLTHEITTPIHDLLNWRYTRFGQQVKSELRGWWVHGVDPLDDYKPMAWGRFKPDADTPVIDREKHKPAKYLSPKGNPSRATLLQVPLHLWQHVSDRYGVPIGLYTCFWQWVEEHSTIPVILIEGEKKAGCLLTLGYVAIALPGFRGAARSYDAEGNRIKPYLTADVAKFVVNRTTLLCFDFETKLKTIREIQKETAKLSRLIRQAGGSCKVIRLPGPEKGVDDLVVAKGATAFHHAYHHAKTLEEWAISEYSQLSYGSNLDLNQQYLGNLPIPTTAKLVAIKSPKGTGKTESFKEIVKLANNQGRRVLLLTHRVQLGQATCDRTGLPFVTELRTTEEGDLFGYGLCVDSLHTHSQARFNANSWHNATVILDEAEQILWHLLSADTEVRNHRIEVLLELKQLFINVLESEHGQVLLSDADLTDLSIRFIQELSGIRVKPWLIVNHWQPQTPWTVFHYAQTQPLAWLSALTQEIAKGPVFIVTHSQKAKSRWSTRTLEKTFQQLYPEKRILRIDSQSIADPKHPAYGCISRINELLPHYDIVICSPSIETGVSIDVRGHFISVWGCLQGVTTADSARQSLARVREAVPRHIWIAKRGLGRIGNGSSSYRSLYASQQRMGKANLWLLQLEQSLLNMDEDNASTSLLALQYWAKMACRINHQMANYREVVLEGLSTEGHRIQDTNAENDPELIEVIQEVRDKQHRDQCEAIATVPTITANQYEELKSKKSKTEEDWHKERKYVLEQRYGLPVTAELVAKDDDGWYPQLRLYYYLLLGRQFVQQRDRAAFDSEVKQGEVWLPTLNRSQLGIQISLLEHLGIKELLKPDRDYRASDPELQRLKAIAQAHRWEIRAALGITVPRDHPDKPTSPIQIAQLFLGKLGLRLSYDRKEGPRGDSKRVYRFLPPKDGRHAVFTAWLERDELNRTHTAVSTPGIDPRQWGVA